MHGIVSFTNLKFSISEFYLVSVYCLLLHSCLFPYHLPLPTAMYLIFCFRLLEMQKCDVSNMLSLPHREFVIFQIESHVYAQPCLDRATPIYNSHEAGIMGAYHHVHFLLVEMGW
jgi:hypothetical protein